MNERPWGRRWDDQEGKRISIHHFHVDHNATCLLPPPPPPPKENRMKKYMHNHYFFPVSPWSQEKSKTKVMQNRAEYSSLP